MRQKRGRKKKVVQQKSVNVTLREEALRPSRFLGFNHDQLGLYLLTREAYEIAESEFRRAIWLNPYEPSFPAHLAWCLYKQDKLAEAREWIEKVRSVKPDSPEFQTIYKAIVDGQRNISEPS